MLSTFSLAHLSLSASLPRVSFGLSIIAVVLAFKLDIAHTGAHFASNAHRKIDMYTSSKARLAYFTLIAFSTTLTFTYVASCAFPCSLFPAARCAAIYTWL